jgi:hypothetical protein
MYLVHDLRQLVAGRALRARRTGTGSDLDHVAGRVEIARQPGDLWNASQTATLIQWMGVISKMWDEVDPANAESYGRLRARSLSDRFYHSVVGTAVADRVQEDGGAILTPTIPLELRIDGSDGKGKLTSVSSLRLGLTAMAALRNLYVWRVERFPAVLSHMSALAIETCVSGRRGVDADETDEHAQADLIHSFHEMLANERVMPRLAGL